MLSNTGVTSFLQNASFLVFCWSMKSGKKCTCFFNGESSTKISPMCFGVLKWKPLSVKKAHWNSTMFLNVWHLVKGLTPTGCLRGRCAPLLVCHVKSNAWYPIKWQGMICKLQLYLDYAHWKQNITILHKAETWPKIWICKSFISVQTNQR